MASRSGSSSSIQNQGDWNYGNFRSHENQASSTVNPGMWHMKFNRPMEAIETRWQHHISQYDGSSSREFYGGGWNGNAEAHSGFKLTSTNGSMRTGASVTVYGYKY